MLLCFHAEVIFVPFDGIIPTLGAAVDRKWVKLTMPRKEIKEGQ